MSKEIGLRGTVQDTGMISGLRRARAGWIDSQWNSAASDVRSDLSAVYNNRLLAFRERDRNLALRVMSVNGNEFAAQNKLVTLAPAIQSETAESIDLSPGIRSVIIIRTMDVGANGRVTPKLIIQQRAVDEQPLDSKRRRGYEIFSDTPGATDVAPIISTEAAGRMPGTLSTINTNTLREDISRALGEKFGLQGNDVFEVSIAGVARNDLSVQDELLMIADTPLSSAQVLKGFQDAKGSRDAADSDIKENFVVIDASADTIKILLTRVESPLPPEDVAAFIAVGYATELQEHGEERAEAWKTEVEMGVEQNYARIDTKVGTFYKENPEALKQIPERFWGKEVASRNPDGYSPYFSTEEQGLKSFEDAMNEAGLLSETSETRRVVENTYLFDVDGVITDPVTQEVCLPVIKKIADILRRKEPIGINTGRAIERLKPVIDALKENLGDDVALLENLAVIGEFGGTWATFDAEGEMHEDAIDTIAVPPGLQEQVAGIVAERYGETMGINSTKTSMITVTKSKTADLPTFKNQQKALAAELTGLLEQNGYDSFYYVHTDKIATNIMSPNVGKDLGAIRFLQFLRDCGIKPKRFITVGDSPSDIKMANELKRRGKNVIYLHVGSFKDIQQGIYAGDIRAEDLYYVVEGNTGGNLESLSRPPEEYGTTISESL